MGLIKVDDKHWIHHRRYFDGPYPHSFIYCSHAKQSRTAATRCMHGQVCGPITIVFVRLFPSVNRVSIQIIFEGFDCGKAILLYKTA